MKDFLLSTAMRAVPWLSGSLVTYGVSSEHAEPISIGLVLLLVSVVDIGYKTFTSKKDG